MNLPLIKSALKAVKSFLGQSSKNPNSPYARAVNSLIDSIDKALVELRHVDVETTTVTSALGGTELLKGLSTAELLALSQAALNEAKCDERLNGCKCRECDEIFPVDLKLGGTKTHQSQLLIEHLVSKHQYLADDAQKALSGSAHFAEHRLTEKCEGAKEDPTSSGRARWTCSCGGTVIHQPYMGDEAWEAVVEKFKSEHVAK